MHTGYTCVQVRARAHTMCININGTLGGTGGVQVGRCVYTQYTMMRTNTNTTSTINDIR